MPNSVLNTGGRGTNVSETSPPVTSDQTELDDRVHIWNFAVMALYQITMRTGWIFKTESIIMPAVLDTIGGPGWLRGCLPMLGRFGQSIPPLLLSHRMKVTPRKKWVLGWFTAGSSAVFLVLASMWLVPGRLGRIWMPTIFLFLYTLFFVCQGINQLAFGTLQGKLVPVCWRGRLMLVSNVLGAGAAVVCAAILLPRWLRPNSGEFDWIFGFAGVCFGVSALVAVILREPRDRISITKPSVRAQLAEAWSIVHHDHRFRRTGIVAVLFGSSLFLFPHYQALGRERLAIPLDNLIYWVIVQNLGMVVFSMALGPLADWRGNRLILRIVFMGLTISPLLALGLSYLGPFGQSFYWLVFLNIGLSPVTIRTLNNYTLELADPPNHPRYLSTLSLCIAIPICFSPLVGLAVDAWGFDLVFLGVAALLFTGWLLTWSLDEPRRTVAHFTVPADTVET